MNTVISADGTTIAYDVYGQGEPVILVEGAFCGRHFGPSNKLAAELGKHFRVYHYDRRARGDSSPSTDYSVERELEDLRALIDVAGGKPALIGFSSGACLAIEAAAAGLPISRLAFYEPPYMVGPKARKVPAGFEQDVQRLVAEGKNGDAVAYFMTKLIGMPSIFLLPMKLTRMWPTLAAQAPSLPFDMAAVNGFAPPETRMQSIRVPALGIYGSKTMPVLKDSTTLCANTIRGADLVVLPGQTHEVKAEAIAPTLIDFFNGVPSRLAAE
ncbi:alpha/beta fold hydrolase [Devosia sp. CN2-171]|jgi:pimeloyl-ACP methyl ester carboxylesterase|uniref:alpha/beta fold hydrolase n=1 Tax=Devosia sp. CN2-171 TaxID=3400909 RepID=UPI003BF89F8B